AVLAPGRAHARGRATGRRPEPRRRLGAGRARPPARWRQPVLTCLAAVDQACLLSEGWFTPSLVGTSPRSKGLIPSRQPTLRPYSFGSERRWWWVWMPQVPQNQWRAVMVLNW